MSWKVVLFRAAHGEQELLVVSELRELVQYTYATNGEEMCTAITNMLKEIPPSNNFSAPSMFKPEFIDMRSVALTKLDSKGDLKEVLGTVKFS